MDKILDMLFTACFINTTKLQEEEPNIYEAGGCAFTDGKLVLAGYQPHKVNPRISGIGGAKQEGETYITTAIRETLEELFEIHPTDEIINQIKMYVMPRKIHHNGSYVIIQYSFEDLLVILQIVNTSNVETPLYESIPLTLHDLLFKRNFVQGAEISHLCLLPVVKHRGEMICPHILSDMKFLM
jgi:hypothetical protein